MPIVKDKYRGTRVYEETRARLINAARERSVVAYHPEITDILEINEPGEHMAGELGQLLGEISEDEHLAGRPMLSAVAISADNRPGKGFFDFARHLKKMVGRDEDTFWQKELKAVYQQWAVTKALRP